MTSNPLPIGERVAWDGTRLRVTDPSLLESISRPHMSASSAKAITSCGARMVAERARPKPFDLFGPAEKGTAAHLVLEHLMQLPPERRDAQHAAKILTDLSRDEPAEGEVDYAKAIGADPVRMTQWLSMVMASAGGLFKIEDPTTVEVEATEFLLSGVEIGGVPIKGFIDRVDRVEGGLKVIDYKTGRDKSKVTPGSRFGDDHGPQIHIYKAALEVATGETVKAGSLYYLDHGKHRRVAVARSHITKTTKWLAGAWDLMRSSIDSATFDTGPSVLCGWCPLVNSCPAAAPPGSSKDKRGEAATAVELGIPVLRRGLPQAPSSAARAAAAFDGELPGAAHRSLGATDTDCGKDTTDMKRTEDKSWITTTDDGTFNFNSYAAKGLAGLLNISVEQITASGRRPRPETMQVLTDFLRETVAEAQAQFTGGSTSLAEGVNTRVRGLLQTYLEMPDRSLPFGQPAEAWTAWRTSAVRFAVAGLATIQRTYDRHEVESVDVGALATLFVPTPAPQPAAV